MKGHQTKNETERSRCVLHTRVQNQVGLIIRSLYCTCIVKVTPWIQVVAFRLSLSLLLSSTCLQHSFPYSSSSSFRFLYISCAFFPYSFLSVSPFHSLHCLSHWYALFFLPFLLLSYIPLCDIQSIQTSKQCTSRDHRETFSWNAYIGILEFTGQNCPRGADATHLSTIAHSRCRMESQRCKLCALCKIHSSNLFILFLCGSILFVLSKNKTAHQSMDRFALASTAIISTHLNRDARWRKNHS